MAMSKHSQECFTPRHDGLALVLAELQVSLYNAAQQVDYCGSHYVTKDGPFMDEAKRVLELIPLVQAALRAVVPSETTSSYSADFIREAIDAEPELPGEMPDAMWEAMKDREYCTEAMRIAVRQTKRGIKERLFKGKP